MRYKYRIIKQVITTIKHKTQTTKKPTINRTLSGFMYFYLLISIDQLLSYTKPPKNTIQNFVVGDFSRDEAEIVQRRTDIQGN